MIVELKIILLLTSYCKIQNIQKCNQRHKESDCHIVFPDISHQHRTESATSHSHHDIGRCLFGISAHPFQT